MGHYLTVPFRALAHHLMLRLDKGLTGQRLPSAYLLTVEAEWQREMRSLSDISEMAERFGTGALAKLPRRPQRERA